MKNDILLPHYYGLSAELRQKAAYRKKADKAQLSDVRQQFYASFFPNGVGERYDVQEVNGFFLVHHKNANGGWQTDLFSKEAYQRYRQRKRGSP